MTKLSESQQRKTRNKRRNIFSFCHFLNTRLKIYSSVGIQFKNMIIYGCFEKQEKNKVFHFNSPSVDALMMQFPFNNLQLVTIKPKGVRNVKGGASP